MPEKEYEVVIKLTRNNSPCHGGLKVGQEWVYNYQPPEGMCLFAYNSIFPFLITLQSGGKFPWQENPDVLTACCPDPDVVNVFELRRREKKTK